MSNSIQTKKQFVLNSIPNQALSYANQLTTQQWNTIINTLRIQTNDNTKYLKELHQWLVSFNSTDEYSTVPDESSLFKHVMSITNGDKTFSGIKSFTDTIISTTSGNTLCSTSGSLSIRAFNNQSDIGGLLIDLHSSKLYEKDTYGNTYYLGVSTSGPFYADTIDRGYKYLAYRDDIPTKVSQLKNDEGYINGVEAQSLIDKTQINPNVYRDTIGSLSNRWSEIYTKYLYSNSVRTNTILPTRTDGTLQSNVSLGDIGNTTYHWFSAYIDTIVSKAITMNGESVATEKYVNDLLSNFSSLDLRPVDELPTEDISTKSIYLLKTRNNESNIYEEYVYINDKWELIGTTEIDLSDYLKKSGDEITGSITLKRGIGKIVSDAGRILLSYSNGIQLGNPNDHITISGNNILLSNVHNIKTHASNTDGTYTLGKANQVLATNGFDRTYWADLPTNITDLEGSDNLITNNDLNEHIQDYDNPHKVTASQLGLATVATSGSYNDLKDLPEIPEISEVPEVNDGVLTIQRNSNTLGTFSANSKDDKSINILVPDGEAAYKNVDDAIHIASTDLPTSKAVAEYVNSLLGQITQIDLLPVDELPTENISTTTIYLLKVIREDVHNIYEEYVYVNNDWELIGNTEVDLSDYLSLSKGGTVTASEGLYLENAVEKNSMHITSDSIQSHSYEDDGTTSFGDLNINTQGGNINIGNGYNIMTVKDVTNINLHAYAAWHKYTHIKPFIDMHVYKANLAASFVEIFSFNLYHYDPTNPTKYFECQLGFYDNDLTLHVGKDNLAINYYRIWHEGNLNPSNYVTYEYASRFATKQDINNAISDGVLADLRDDVTIIEGDLDTARTDIAQIQNKLQGLPDTVEDLATKTYVSTQVANLVNSAPDTLNTLNELATALGNDPNFATTITTQIGNKLDKSNGTLTGPLKVTGGDSVTAGKIILDQNNNGQITNIGTQTLFGFTNKTTVVVGHSSYKTNIRGSSIEALATLQTRAILPVTNNTYNLGSSTVQYANIYGANIYQDGKQVASTDMVPPKTDDGYTWVLDQADIRRLKLVEGGQIFYNWDVGDYDGTVIKYHAYGGNSSASGTIGFTYEGMPLFTNAHSDGGKCIALKDAWDDKPVLYMFPGEPNDIDSEGWCDLASKAYVNSKVKTYTAGTGISISSDGVISVNLPTAEGEYF